MIELSKYEAGKYQRDPSGYSYFIPSQINNNWSWTDQQINTLLEKASIRLGELNSFARLVPNIGLFIQLHVTKEAVVSSRIEGTQTKIDEVLLRESEIKPERKDDYQEVINYIKAMNNAVALLPDLPVSSRLMNLTHKTLMQGVRGENKMPGEFRKSQNWIGGTNPMDALFVPPHHSLVPRSMNDLEMFIHNNNCHIPELIKIAITHYQFETIHPYLDGNGRIGRLLITLLMIEKEVLSQPLLYLSTFFERNKSLYYDNLTFVRTRNNMKQWIKYFLIAIAETAEEAGKRLSRILEFKKEQESFIKEKFGRRTDNALKLLDLLFTKPVVYVSDVQETLQLTYKSSNSLISQFVEFSMIEKLSFGERKRVFMFRDYLTLFDA